MRECSTCKNTRTVDVLTANFALLRKIKVKQWKMLSKICSVDRIFSMERAFSSLPLMQDRTRSQFHEGRHAYQVWSMATG